MKMHSQQSPFHSGEQFIQEKLGVRDKMEQFGRQVIRDYLPEQHQKFYQQLPYIFAGHVDNKGWPWASMLLAEPGFMRASDQHHLDFTIKPFTGDPLADAINVGTEIGLVGVELHSRRRNRVSGTIVACDDIHFSLKVKQSFGNCPQYIQARSLSIYPKKTSKSNSNTNTKIEDTSDTISAANKVHLTALDSEASKLIRQADTFFVSSHSLNKSGSTSKFNNENNSIESRGVDISHRGGRAGFVKVEGNILTIPDYSGNFHFNTLGNFLVDSKAGLLFIDFESGDILMLTGHAEIIWDSVDIEEFEGAERLWTFTLDHGYRLKGAFNNQWSAPEFSQNSLFTGSWPQLAEQRALAEQSKQWQEVTVIDTVNESLRADGSSSVRSFYLHANTIYPFSAGQFLTIKQTIDGKELIRNYTVSSHKYDNYYRISVKRDGAFSNHLHDSINIGDQLSIQIPRGNFHWPLSPRLDQKMRNKKTTLLLSAGIGITPMISIAKQALAESQRLRTQFPMLLIASVTNRAEQTFLQELHDIERQSAGMIQILWCITKNSTQESSTRGNNSHSLGEHLILGRITRKLLSDTFFAQIPANDVDVYVCGPTGFMQSMYDDLRSLEVPDTNIHAEAFGPASFQRDSSSAENDRLIEQLNLPEQATITVENAVGEISMEQRWTPEDGNLLDFSEKHGLIPNFSCRNGQCGSCKSQLVSGSIAHTSTGHLPIESDELLLCCAQPTSEDVVIKLSS